MTAPGTSDQQHEAYWHCADIGSTWTKTALFLVASDGAVCLLARHDLPTTADDLSRGFFAGREAVLRQAGVAEAAVTGTEASSSAKGGLGVVALGLVPELTVKAARAAAASAGGKILGTFTGVLAPSDREAMAELSPDIVLFCGGTDHGNRTMVLENARRLRGLDPGMVILYAGNRACRDEVCAILSDRQVVCADNVMPEVNLLAVEDARRAIRELFLARIAQGKGLGPVLAATAGRLLPTPLAVHGLIERLDEDHVLGAPFLVLDPGGATTDVYSACVACDGAAGVVYRGLPEPTVKRTVEGDLGLRHSAPTALLAVGEDDPTLLAAATHLATVPESLPADAAGRDLERRLAVACLAEGMRRHAGILRTVWTPHGAVSVQTGKDLRSVAVVVGSGGFLSRCADAPLLDASLRRLSTGQPDPEVRLLTPPAPSWRRDAEHLLPLAALLARRTRLAPTWFAAQLT